MLQNSSSLDSKKLQAGTDSSFEHFYLHCPRSVCTPYQYSMLDLYGLNLNSKFAVGDSHGFNFGRSFGHYHKTETTLLRSLPLHSLQFVLTICILLSKFLSEICFHEQDWLQHWLDKYSLDIILYPQTSLHDHHALNLQESHQSHSRFSSALQRRKLAHLNLGPCLSEKHMNVCILIVKRMTHVHVK